MDAPFARAALVLGLLAAGAHVADAKKLLVTRADSSADYETRKRVEAAVMGLVRGIDRGVGITEVTFADLSLAAGCTGPFVACKDAIADSLAVDEIVQITIVPAGKNAVNVLVRRGGKGVPMREASAQIPLATLEDAIAAQLGPLFGVRRIAAVAKPAAKAKPAKADARPPIVVRTGPERPIAAKPSLDTAQRRDDEDPLTAKKAMVSEAAPSPSPPPPPPPVEVKAAPPPPPPPPTPPPTTVAMATPEVAEAPVMGSERVDGAPRRRVYLGGAVAGGALFLGGLLLWQQARDTDGELAAAPRNTSADIARILELEASGDRAAMWGNIAVVGGAAIAGVCTYLYIRSGKRSGAVAMPLVVDGGGGLAVRWGGL